MARPADKLTERWRPVIGWEPYYQVSSLGRVRSLPRVVEHRNKQAWCRIKRKGRVLKQSLRAGYWFVQLSKDGKAKSYHVHRLMACSFLPNKRGYPVVRHKDGSRMNNTIDNLQWGTHADNTADMRRHGTMSLGTARPLAKLNDRSVTRLRQKFHDGAGIMALAKEFGVTHKTAGQAARGETWRHV